MILPKLAWRNILGAGTRTWLNVAALSLSFVAIIFTQGLYNGVYDQVEHATVDALYGGGQFWVDAYDPDDPLSLADAHAPLPPTLDGLVQRGDAAPILLRQATIYPRGRIRSIVLKGISPGQKVVSIPSFFLKGDSVDVPALIGSRMASTLGMTKGDRITVQWRDLHGTFDARDVRIMEVMKTPVQEIDNEQIWVPLERLQTLLAMPGQATIVVLKQGQPPPADPPGWQLRSPDDLLRDLHALVRTKTLSASILYLVLLFLALLAVFDTQVLSIFRRRKEMGTLMALGMTRSRIIGLFTLEGALHAILAGLAATLYGGPLLAYFARTGWALPQSYDTIGYAIGDRMFPAYSAGLIVGTTLLILVTTTIVSFLPTRKIARLRPTDALRGKMS